MGILRKKVPTSWGLFVTGEPVRPLTYSKVDTKFLRVLKRLGSHLTVIVLGVVSSVLAAIIIFLVLGK